MCSLKMCSIFRLMNQEMYGTKKIKYGLHLKIQSMLSMLTSVYTFDIKSKSAEVKCNVSDTSVLGKSFCDRIFPLSSHITSY